MTRLFGVIFLAAALGAGLACAEVVPNIGKGGFLGPELNMSSTSASNTAGVLSYCVDNHYLKGDAAQSAASALSHLGGQNGVKSSSGFAAGQKGSLETGSGDVFSMSSLEDKAKPRICELVLEHAQSLL